MSVRGASIEGAMRTEMTDPILILLSLLEQKRFFSNRVKVHSQPSHFVTCNGAPTTNDFTHAKPPVASNHQDKADAHVFELEIVPPCELDLHVVQFFPHFLITNWQAGQPCIK